MRQKATPAFYVTALREQRDVGLRPESVPKMAAMSS